MTDNLRKYKNTPVLHRDYFSTDAFRQPTAHDAMENAL